MRVRAFIAGVYVGETDIADKTVFDLEVEIINRNGTHLPITIKGTIVLDSKNMLVP